MNQYTQTININGTTYKFHKQTNTETLRTVEKQLQGKLKGLTLFNQLYGRIASEHEKKTRKIINAILRAKHNPINENKNEIIVKMSDRNIRIKPLIYKD